MNPSPPRWRRRHYKQRGIGRHRAEGGRWGGGMHGPRSKRGKRKKDPVSLSLSSSSRVRAAASALAREGEEEELAITRGASSSSSSFSSSASSSSSSHAPSSERGGEGKSRKYWFASPPSPRPIGFPLPLKSRGAAGSLFLSNLFRSFSFLSVRRSLHPSPRSIRRPSPPPPFGGPR